MLHSLKNQSVVYLVAFLMIAFLAQGWAQDDGDSVEPAKQQWEYLVETPARFNTEYLNLKAKEGWELFDVENSILNDGRIIRYSVVLRKPAN